MTSTQSNTDKPSCRGRWLSELRGLVSCRRFFSFICVAFLVISGAVLPSGCKPKTEEDIASDVHRIRLGAVLPLTGDIASYGKAAQRGIDLAVAEVNGRGGVRDRRVEVIYEDDRGNATTAVAAMQKLVMVNRVPVVFGSAASSVTVAITPLTNREKVVLISPISSSKELSEVGGPFFFRTCPSDVLQAAMVADWLQEEGHRTAGVIYVNNSWGQGLKDEFVDRFKAIGGSVVAVEACREGDRDLRTQLAKVKNANPEAVYAITYGREGGALLRQAKELDIGIPIYGADVWGSPELHETAGDAARGVRIIVPQTFENDSYHAFALAFRNKYGEDPDIYASYAYDAANIVFDGLEIADRGSDLRDAIAAMSHQGVTGLTRFDKNGDVVGKGFERKILPR